MHIIASEALDVSQHLSSLTHADADRRLAQFSSGLIADSS
jgi:hypothetical protein